MLSTTTVLMWSKLPEVRSLVHVFEGGPVEAVGDDDLGSLVFVLVEGLFS